jgi:GT2 family glycosyltransferase
MIDRLPMTVAIIILSYNNLDTTTKPCIESIYSHNTDIACELVVVDNLSTDGTRQYLTEIKNSHANLHIILNDANYGYAKGNNIGIRSIDADYYVLLNSDTIVTDRWLDKLVSFLQTHANVGLVGPVSNNVGCEQKIHSLHDAEAEIIADGLRWAELCKGDYFYPDTLGFFCVAIPRRTIDEVGLLDESYGLGTFEDYDYCYRVETAGYEIACMEDVFVYHKGSISFKNANIDLNRLYIENMRLFEAKHGVQWLSGHAVEPFIKLLQEYVNSLDSGNIDKVKAKIINKLATMESLGFSDVYRDFIEAQRELQIASMRTQQPSSAEQELIRIKSSLTWRIASRVHRLIDRLMPKRPRIHENGTLDRDRNELARILSQHPNKPIMISFPSHEWNVPLYQRWQHMAINLSRHGLLYFFCTCNINYDNYSGFQQMSDSCYVTNRFDLLVELPDLKIFHEYSTDLGTPWQKIETLLSTGNTVVYEYFDELHENLFNCTIPQQALIKHSEILKDTRCLVVTTADKLTDDVRRYRNDYIVQAENGVDYDHFSQFIYQSDIPEEIQRITNKNKPIIGYFGAFASWFDYDLIIELATKRPEYELLLIGLNYDKTLDAYDLSGFNNVTILDYVSYKELPTFAQCFSVATIPFRLNCLTEATSPIKMFEYMALGHPIVTTGLRECRKYASVLVADDAADFIEKIDKAIFLKNDPHYQALLKKEALENSWMSRAAVVADAIKERIRSRDFTTVQPHARVTG